MWFWFGVFWCCCWFCCCWVFFCFGRLIVCVLNGCVWLLLIVLCLVLNGCWFLLFGLVVWWWGLNFMFGFMSRIRNCGVSCRRCWSGKRLLFSWSRKMLSFCCKIMFVLIWC